MKQDMHIQQRMGKFWSALRNRLATQPYSHQGHVLFLVIFMVLGSRVIAQQTFPVQIISNVAPPHSPYLSDYQYPQSMIVNIILKGRASYSGYLKLKLESMDGRGIVIQTRANYNPVVDLGPNQTFTGVELAPYLNQENLDFIGFDRQQYLRTKRIPDGIYRLTFSFFDRFRPEKLVSNTDIFSQKILRVFAIQPVLINLPLQMGSVNTANESTGAFNINWTRPANTPFTPQYEVIINELRPSCQSSFNGINPNNAAASRVSQAELFNCLGPEIYRTSTTALTLNYGMQAEPLLGLGKWYAVRVKASDSQGRTLFINNGVSKIRVFRYGKPCEAPTGLKVTSPNPYTAKLTWNLMGGHTGYLVQFRKRPSGEWYSQEAVSNGVEIRDLEPSTRYEFRISALCNAFSSDLGQGVEHETPGIPPSKVTCGKPLTVDLSNQNPIREALKPGDKVIAGDFEVLLTEVQPLGGGWFKGKGQTTLNIFQAAKIVVAFQRVKINTDRRLIAGEMSATGGVSVIPNEWKEKYLSFTGEINRIFEEIEKGLNTVGAVVGKIDEVLKKIDKWLENYQGEDKAELLETIRIGKKEIEEGKKALKEKKVGEALKKLKDGSGKVLRVAGKVAKEKLENFFKGLKELIKEILQELKQESQRLIGQKKEAKKRRLTRMVLLLESYNEIDSTQWINEPPGDDPAVITSLSSESRTLSKQEVKEIRTEINKKDPEKRWSKYLDALVTLQVEEWNFGQIGETLSKNLQKLVDGIKKDAPDLIKAITNDLLDGKDTAVIKGKLKAFVKKRFEDAKQNFLKEIKKKG